MQNKYLFKLVKYDLSSGFNSNAPKYGILTLVFSLFCITFFNSVTSLSSINEKGSLMDCMLYMFKGMEVYMPSSGEPFIIPIVWLLIQALIALLIVTYPTGDLHSYGLQIFMRTKNRFSWWISKCVWNVFTTISVYALSFFIIFIFTAIFGKLSLIPNLEINQSINLLNVKDVNMQSLCLAVFLLPMLTSIAVSLMQMALSFILNPIYSYIIVICIFVASAYYCSPALIGNYSMIARNTSLYEHGIDSMVAILSNLFVILLSIVIGLICFKRCDILKKN